MRGIVRGIVMMGLLVSAGPVWAQGEHEHEHDHAHGKGVQEIAIKGELVDSLCYVGMAAKGTSLR